MGYLCILLLWVFIAFAGGVERAEAIWFNSSWDYRVKVEVNPTKVGTTTAVSSFPVYLDLAGMPASFWSVATTGDVRVVESDDTTETPFEIVSFSTSTKRGELHFLADSLSTTSSSTFYVYYGNPAATQYAVTDTYGRNAVWASYNHVWHLGNAIDAAGVAANGTDTGVTYPSGKLGEAAKFTGTQQIEVASGVDDTQNTTSYSIYGWASSSEISSWFLAHQNNSTFRSQKDVMILGGDLTFQINPLNSGANQLVVEQASETYNDGTWRFFSITYDGSRSTAGVDFYLNGINYARTSLVNNMTSNSPTAIPLFLGSRGAAGTNLTGMMDEWRIKPERLSASYILTQYNNQSSTSTFLYIGPQEAEAPPEATTTPSTLLRGGAQIRGGIIIK